MVKPDGPSGPEGPQGPDGSSSATLFAELYNELRRLAQHRLGGERSNHTLQATALVHEVFLRIAGDRPAGWQSPAQFFVAAAEAMRRILIDHARKHGSKKRGRDAERLSLSVLDLAQEVNLEEALALDAALVQLREQDPRGAEIVSLRFFAGLNVAETARTLGLSERTVRREWAFARAWLFQALAIDH